jgi:gluconate 2-dehydrogenase gamma chain
MSKSEEKDPNVHELRITRRGLLQGSGAAVAAAGVAAVSTVPLAAAQDATPAASPAASPMAGMPGMLSGGDTPVLFFTVEQAQLVDALVSRIMPGDESDPGAHEAGVVAYIDRSLAGTNLGYDLKTYQQGPFLITEEAPTPVEASSATDIYRAVLVPTDLASRYGYQSAMTRQQVYVRGLQFVQEYVDTQFQKAFSDLTPDEQDSIIADMASDKATGFEGPTAAAFFITLRNDTIEGMFSDPMYGGNKDLVGWKLIGYPGAQMFYLPADLTKPNTRQPQSLNQMMETSQNS